MPGPLVKKDLTEINLRLDQLLEADEQIKLAERAGLEMEEMKTSARTLRSQLIKIKQTYFPGE